MIKLNRQVESLENIQSKIEEKMESLQGKIEDIESRAAESDRDLTRTE